MKYIEIILLVFAYTTIVASMLLQFACYKKNLEKLETIAFSFSILLLIVSITASRFFGETDASDITNIFILLSMILVSLTTPLSVLADRIHNISFFWKRLLCISSGILFIAVCICFYLKKMLFIEYFVVGFLVITLTFSALFTRKAKPIQIIEHIDKSERIFAVAFLIIIPTSLASNYIFIDHELKLGFTIPLIFTLLSGNKLFNDVQRLSLFKTTTKTKYNTQHFKNFSISKREEEVALLLIEAKTYKVISEELFISIPTVKTHASSIYKKCSVKNRAELTVLFLN